LEEGEEEGEGAGAVWDMELEYCSWEESVQWVTRREGSPYRAWRKLPTKQRRHRVVPLCYSGSSELRLLDSGRHHSVTVLFSSDIASRIGAEVATFAVPDHKFLQAIIEHCPSLEAINLVELGKSSESAKSRL